MKKLTFKKYLIRKKRKLFFLSSKFYDYLYDYYNEYKEYCEINNFEHEDLDNDYKESIALNEFDSSKYNVNDEKMDIPMVNEHGERWSGAIYTYTDELVYGLDVPDWLKDEYKSFCENITTDKINNGMVFIRVADKEIFKVIAYTDYVFILENGETIDLIREGVNEMEIDCYPPETVEYLGDNNYIYKASYGISIEIGHRGYNEILVFVAKNEYINDIIKLCSK